MEQCKIKYTRMRQSVQKELGFLKEDTTTKIRTVQPYSRKIKHKNLQFNL